MIKAEQKPLDEIAEMLKPYRRILVLACNTCVAVCFAGGEREAEMLATSLSIKLKGKKIVWAATQRQCENEFVDSVADKILENDAVLSTACGIGVQAVAERFAKVPVSPALNTSFLGKVEVPGVFSEYCCACGDCILDETAGICPIARCAKNLLNGPCGGSQDGRCEVSKDTPCAWQLIYERLKSFGNLNELNKIKPAKDWSAKKEGGPRRIVREDLKIEE